MLWPLLVVGAAALQVVRNAAQRSLTDGLGVWGAAYVRFLYGLPFALLWTALILAWRGPSGAFSVPFLNWILLGASAQWIATAALVLAMSGRGFAVATALQKTEILGSAALGVLLIQDVLSLGDWAGAALGTAGVVLMSRLSVTRDALIAAIAGAGAGLLFSVSAVSYRAATQSWGGDEWVAGAACLSVTLAAQCIGGAIAMARFAPNALRAALAAWRPSLVPGAAGAFSSALLFTGFAMGPSAAAVKTVQLVDVIIAWAVSKRLFQERTSLYEKLGAAMIVAGALTVLAL